MNGRYLMRVRKHAHALEPVLDQETFVVTELDDRPDGFHKALHIAAEDDVVLHDGKERVDYDTSRGLQYRIRWRWADGARERLEAFVEQQDKLPCGCRRHVPDSRDDPEGVVSCKHCGESYPEERFREIVTA